MANEHEIILIPRINVIKVDDAKLKSDIETLANKVNTKGLLKLSASVDTDSLYKSIRSMPKTDLPKITLDTVIDTSKLTANIQTALKAIQMTETAIDVTPNMSNLTENINRVNQLKSEYKQLISTIREIGKLEIKIAGFEGNQNSPILEIYRKDLEALQGQLSRLDTSVKGNPLAEKILGTEKLIALERELELSKAKVAEAAHLAQTAEMSATEDGTQKLTSLLGRMDVMRTKWSELTKDPSISVKFDNLHDKIKNAISEGDISRVKEYNRAVSELSKEIKKNDLDHRTFGETISQTGERLKAYIASFLSFQFILNNLSNAVQAVKEIDSSLTELRKVSDLSGESLNIFVERAFEAADEIGRTGKDMLDAVTEFRRAGYELESAFELGQAALMMTNIGDGIRSTKDAASALIAVLRGFKLPETDVMSVVDAINEVSNTSPIGFKDITEGLRRVSGTLYQTGTDINQTMGLLTGGFAQLRDIENVSSGLIMISQRLRGIGEDGNKIEGLAPKLQEAFKDVADIDISKGNGELRSTYEILEDMARVFPTLTEEQRQYLGELAAGNQRIRVLNAIISGWDDVEKAVTGALNSTNSALTENAKFMNSIEGRTQSFQSSFQNMANSLIDSGLVKWLISAGTAATDFIGIIGGSFIGQTGMVITTITTLVAALKTFNDTNLGKNISSGFKSFADFFKNAGNFTEYGKSIDIIRQAGDKAITSIQGMSMAIHGLSQKETVAFLVQNQLRLGTQALTTEQMASLLVTKGMTVEKANETAAEIANTAAKAANATATTSQTAVNTGFLASLKATTAGLLAQAAAWAVSPLGTATLTVGAIIGIVKIVDTLTVSLEEQKEKLNQIKQEYDSLSNSLSGAEQEQEKVNERIKELLELQKSGNITFVEEDELTKLRETNIELEKQIALFKIQQETKNKELVSNVVAVLDKDLGSAEIEYVYEKGKIVGYSFAHGVEDALSTISKIITFGLSENPRWVDHIQNVTRDGRSGSIATENAYLEQQIKRYQELGKAIHDVKVRINELEANKANNTITKVENKELQQLWKDVGEYEQIHEYLLKKQSELKTTIGDLKLISSPETEDEAAFNEWYQLYQMLNDTILKVSNPEEYRKIKFSEIISTEDFSDIVGQLNGLGKKGEVSAEVIRSHEKFADALEKNGISAEEAAVRFNNLGKSIESYNDSSFVRLSDIVAGITEELSLLDIVQRDFAKDLELSDKELEDYTKSVEKLKDTYSLLYAAIIKYNGAKTEENEQLVRSVLNYYQEEEAAKKTKNTYEDNTSALQKLYSVQKDNNDGKKMSYFQMLDLIMQYPQLANSIKLTENGYILEGNALEKLIELKREDLRLSIESQRTKINSEFKTNTAASDKTTENLLEKIQSGEIASGQQYIDDMKRLHGENVVILDGLREWIDDQIAIEKALKFSASEIKFPTIDTNSSSSNSSKSSPTQKSFDYSNFYSEQLKDLEKRLEPIDKEIARIESEISRAEIIGDTNLVSNLTSQLVEAQSVRKEILEKMLIDTKNITALIKSTFEEFADTDMSEYGIAKFRQNLNNKITLLENTNTDNINDSEIETLKYRLTRFNEYVDAVQAGAKQADTLQSQIDKISDDIFRTSIEEADRQSQEQLSALNELFEKRSITDKEYINGLENLLKNSDISNTQREKIRDDISKFFDEEYSRNKKDIETRENLLLPDDFEDQTQIALEKIENAKSAIEKAISEGYGKGSALMDSLESDLSGYWTKYYETQLNAAQDSLTKTGDNILYQKTLNDLLNDGNAELINKLSIINAIEESNRQYYEKEIDYLQRELDLYKKNANGNEDPLKIIEYLDKIKAKAHEAANDLRKELSDNGWEKDLIEYHPDITKYSDIWWSAEDETKSQRRNQIFAEFDKIVKNTTRSIELLDRKFSELSSTDIDQKTDIITDKIKLLESETTQIIPQFDKLRQALKDGTLSQAEFSDETDKLSKTLYDNNRAIQENKATLATLSQDIEINKTADAIENLNHQMRLIAESDYDGKISAVTRQLELENKSIDLNAEKLKNINVLYQSGEMNAADYEKTIKEVTKAWQDGVVKAAEYEKQLINIEIAQMNAQLSRLNEHKDAVNSIVDMVKNLIKQETADNVKALNDEITKLNNQKKALNDIEKELNNALKERKKLDDDRKKDLDNELKLQRDLAKEAKKRLDDELDTYKEIIDARKKLLENESDDRYYEQDLAAKQLEIQKIQDRLSELQNNDSSESRKEKAELAEQLAKKELDLDNFVYDNSKKNQLKALDDELERYLKGKEAEKDAIDAGLEAYETAHQGKLDMIDAELEAYENSINAQIEAMKLHGEEYDAQIERIKEQIDEIQARIANNGELTLMAMERIDREGSAIYEKLLNYNRIYGTGIDEDVTGAWENYLRLVDTGNNTTLENTRQIYREILDLTLQISNLQSNLNNFSGNLDMFQQIADIQENISSLSPSSNNDYFSGTTGLRDFFEKQGYNVDWDEKTKEFLINGQRFSSDGYQEVGDRLVATWEQLQYISQQLLSNVSDYVPENKIQQTDYFGGTIGLRQFFENRNSTLGKDNTVDWDDKTKEFIINGQRFSSDGIQNTDGTLYVTWEQLQDILRRLPSYDKGGLVKEDTLALIHKDERVLTPEQTKAYDSGEIGKFELLKIDPETFASWFDSHARYDMRNRIFQSQWEDAASGNAINNMTNNVNNAPSVHIENTFNGVTSEKFIKELPQHMKSIAKMEAKSEVGEYNRKFNNSAKAKGVGGRFNPL